MGISERSTETFVQVYIPELVTATPGEALDAYREFRDVLDHAVGPADEPQQSNLRWDVLQEAMDEANGDNGETRERINSVARTTHALVHDFPAGTGGVRGLRLHDPVGTMLVVTADGKVRAGESVPNPELAAYGPLDRYVLGKLADAVLVESVQRQGADWGEGYEVLLGVKRALGLTGPEERPHIGMATIHRDPYDADRIGTDRHALAYAAVSGRTMTPAFREYVGLHLPAYRARMINGGDPAHPEDLSGWLDTQSGAVACRATIFPVEYGHSSLAAHWGGAAPGELHSQWPDPDAAENIRVNWN